MEKPPHIYEQGRANSWIDGNKIRNPEYEKRRKRRSEMNNKLCAALKKHFQVDIPDGFDLFELLPESTGRYGLKCKVGDEKSEQVINLAFTDKKLIEMDSDKLIKLTEELAETYKKEKETYGYPSNETELSLKKAIMIIKERKLMTQDEASDLLREKDEWENIGTEKLIGDDITVT